MNRGAPPARSGIKLRVALTCTSLLVGAVGCTDGPSGLDGETHPQFSISDNPEGTPARIRATSGGRVDFPFGTGQKNPGQLYQTWGAHIADGNADGIPDANSQLEFTDHRTEARMNGKPLTFKSIQFTSALRIIKGNCPQGAILARGTLDVKNTPGQENWNFRLILCDANEPGSKDFPFDQFDLLIETPGFQDQIGRA